jgi:hypothetical protein
MREYRQRTPARSTARRTPSDQSRWGHENSELAVVVTPCVISS